MTQKLQIIPGVVAWYPPAGVSFAFLLAVGPRFIPAVFVASLLSNFLIYDIPAPAPTLIAWAAIYSGVYGIASGILRGWIRVDPRLRSLRDVLWMILTASVVASILAIISVSASAAAGVVPAGKSNAALLEWWIGETIGVLVVAPALLIHGMPWVKRFAAGGPSRSWRRVAISQPTAKTLLQAVSVLAALYLVFGVPALEPFHPLYLLAVPLIWISLDYGLSGISLGILAVNFGCTFLMWSMHFDPARLGELQLLLLVISAVGLLLGVVRTERLQANEALLGSEAKFRTLIEQLPTIVYINPADDPSHSLYVSPQIESVLGYTPKEWLEDPKLWEKRLHPDDRAAVMADVEHIKTTGVPWSVEYRLLAKDGRAVWMHDQVVLVHDADGRPQFWQGVMTDVSARQIAKAAQEQSEKLFRALFEFSPEAILLIDPHSSDGSWRIVDCNLKACDMNGYSREELVGHSIDVFNATPGIPDERIARLKLLREVGNFEGQGVHRHKDGTLFPIEYSSTLITLGERELVIGIDRDITERKRAEESLLRSQDRYRSLFEDSPIALWEEDYSGAKKLLDGLRESGITDFTAYLTDHPETIAECTSLVQVLDVNKAAVQLYQAKSKADLTGSLSEVVSPEIRDHLRDELVSVAEGRTKYTWDGHDKTLAGTPLDIRVSLSIAPGFEHDLSKVIISVVDLTEVKQSEAKIRRQLEYLAALTEIDRAITSSVGLDISLGTVLTYVTTQLGVDAAAVLLLDSSTLSLRFAAGRGFRTPGIDRSISVRLGEGYAGRAALERRTVHVPHIAARNDNPLLQESLPNDGFVSYYGVPLIAKGTVVGVLEIFHRAKLDPDQEWLDFLNTLAGQAAIAIDSANMFDGLQHSNLELTLAYDATIEGWSHALDLRDRETEGHTQRVTTLTLKLARLANVRDEELIHIRRGSLLHDIGKMGVPDEVLLKPGPLTDEEWVIMRKHPVLAYEMLSPIQYLQPALDIPYCHHEKWDGTGYPRGLRGEQIPAAARIFAVVDVWDALLSDRPYRKAWPAEKALEHIRGLSGTHFDPAMVQLFLREVKY